MGLTLYCGHVLFMILWNEGGLKNAAAVAGTSTGIDKISVEFIMMRLLNVSV